MQQHSLLATKLHTPPTRPELVSRPRLVERLNLGLPGQSGFARKLTLISAPAGFGKTTMVTQWLKSAQYPVAWLSLDGNDNAPARFLAYVVAALRTLDLAGAAGSAAPGAGREQEPRDPIARGTLAALQSPQPPPAEAVLTSLINEITTLPDGIILVLDDYHLIEAKTVHDALAFFLDHLPPQMHLVIAAREDPPLPLARLRARGQLTEARASDLRFTTSETAEFLNQMMGLNLSAEDISALERRTEGWIAGLQLAAISMQGRKDASSLIRSFTGSHRYVLDYLVEEVLEQQPASVQAFLLQTSILNRLTGSMCDALTGQDDGQATLEMLDRANLFIVTLDEERRWYRYHHLFAELLRQRLTFAHPDWVDTLHARAVNWYEANGDLSEAVYHAFAMEDVETAARLIERGALEALRRCDYEFIFDGVDRLPDDEVRAHPWLFIYHSWALLATAQVGVAGPRLENTDWLLDSLPEDEQTKRREMLGYIAALKAQYCVWRRDYANLVDYAEQARANLPSDNWMRGFCATMLGAAYWANGDLAAAKDAFAEASSIGKASVNPMVEMSGSCNLGHSLELEGRLQQARKLHRDTLRLAERGGRLYPVAGYIHNELTRSLYELNELDLAVQHLTEGIKLCQRIPDGRAVSYAYCLQARVQIAQGDLDGATSSIQKAEEADPSPGTPFDMRGADYPRVRLWLKENRLGESSAWLNENRIDVDAVSNFKIKLTYTMHARALIALSREHPDGTYLNDAQYLLEELLELAAKAGWGSKVIEILALQALALQEEQNTAQAMLRLERALTLAEPEGFVRTFVDEGQPMARLLYEAAARGIAPDYARRLLAAFPMPEPEPTDPSISKAQESDLIEPLSEREIEVLQLIAEGLTNPEIASRLFVSLNTVKAHARNIYGKLGVHNRTQAVGRARALGVLPYS